MGKYFGTDGVRGRYGDILTPQLAKKIGLFLGEFPKGNTTQILLGQDPRFSSPSLAEAIKEGLIESGATIYDLGVTTTPSLSYLITQMPQIDFAIMISASHNPSEDNGIKIFNASGEKIDEGVEQQIEFFIDNPLLTRTLQQKGKVIAAQDLVQQYLDYIIQTATFRNPKGKILIDCAHGSASLLIQQVISKLKIDADIIFNQPDGYNINQQCGATHLENLKNKLQKEPYFLGLAFDGDGDRMMGVLPNGRIIDGDAQIYLNALAMKKDQTLKKNQVVVTVMSNLGLKRALANHDISCVEVPVGDRNVQLALKQQGMNLGGEQSGHVIFYDALNTGSGFYSMIRLLNLLFKKDYSFEKELQSLIIYPQLLKNVKVKNKEKLMKNTELNQAIRTIQETLGGEGRILVRPSGTEPLVRVMVEAKNDLICEANVKKIIQLIERLEQ